MNLDSLSFTLSQISYLVANLSKKNYKSSVQELYYLATLRGSEANRHLLRCLLSYVEVGSGEGKGSLQVQLLQQECTSLLSKPGLITNLCYAFDHPLHLQKSVRPAQQLLPLLSRLLRLSPVQDIVLGLALLHSSLPETKSNALNFVRQRLPEFIKTFIDSDHGSTPEGIFHDISLDVLHLILSALNSSSEHLGVSYEAKESFLNCIRKDQTQKIIPVVLAPLLFRDQVDLPVEIVSQDPSAMASSMLDGSLADLIVELGYGCCSSPTECKRALSSLGTREITPAAVAHVVGAMVRTHSSLDQSSRAWADKDKAESMPRTWNVEILVQTIKELAPNLRWDDVIKELDHPEFCVKDRKGLTLLMTALRLGLKAQGYHPDTFPFDRFYRIWDNAEGQFSLIQQILKCGDVFNLSDHTFRAVSVDVLKVPPDADNKEANAWRSLDLVETLLLLSDRGLYMQVLELMKSAIPVVPDILALALIQANLQSSQTSSHSVIMRHELLSILIPIFLGNHPNSAIILHHAWHAQNSYFQPVVMAAMADWYMRGDSDQTRLTRILDVSQDLKGLSMLLNEQTYPFVIDLACLASRREFLKLEKWLTDKIQQQGESFIAACVKFLQRRCPQIMGGIMKDDPIPKAAQLPQETIGTLAACLQACERNVSTELAEIIRTTINNCKMIIGSPRQLPPGVIRTHLALDTPFNSTPVGAQMFSSTPVDPIAGISTSLAGITLGGGSVSNSNAIGSIGPLSNSAFNLPGSLGPLVSTPGSPSRMIGPGAPSSAQSPYNPMIPLGQQLHTGGAVGSQLVSSVSNSQPLAQSGMSMSTISSLARLASQPDKSRLGTGEPTSLFPEAQAQSVSKEVEDEANSYFQRIYNHPPHPTLSIDEVLEMLKKFEKSPNQREQDVFFCMLRNLFEEYKFFPQYPEKELYITAQLFGGIIERGLISSNYMALGIALRYVLDALRKPFGTKMFFFGITALDRFKTRLKEYHQYCEHVVQLPHFSDFPSPLIEYVESGLKSQEPSGLPANISGSPAPTTSGALKGISAAPGSSTSTSTVKPAITSSMPSRPSIAMATNIDTLLVATEKEEKMTAPPESLQDKIAFIFNNLSQLNLQSKCDDLRDLITEEYWPWVSQYLVMKRASIEFNFHALYSNFLDVLKVPELNNMVVRETFRNIRVLLLSDKGIANFSDRSLLKNLGHWLGMLTLARNKPILQIDMDMKALLAEAYHNGQQELLYVVPFVAKVLEACAKSKVFKPPNPWTMSLMNVLAELHQEPDLKLNLKFEIEVLCKNLNIDVFELKPTLYLKDQDKLRLLEYQLSQPIPKSEDAIPTSSVLQSSSVVQSISQQQSVTTTAAAAAAAAAAAEELSAQLAAVSVTSSVAPPPSGSVVTAVTASPPTPSMPSGPPEPRFNYHDISVGNLSACLAPHVVAPNLQLFQVQPQLKQYIRPAIERAVQEWIHPVVDRSIKIALTTCEQIVKKDFALDPDEARMRASAHHMVRNLTAGMAMITCRDNILVSIGANLKSAFLSSLIGATAQHKEMAEQAATLVASENMEVACAYIQKTAIDKAIPEIDKRLVNEIEIRKLARSEGRRYCDTLVLTYQAERMPEQIRLKVGAVTPQQMAVYEEFAHNIPGFQPISERDAALFIPKPVNDTMPAAQFSAPGPSTMGYGATAVEVIGATGDNLNTADHLGVQYEKVRLDVEQWLQNGGIGLSSNQATQLHSLLEALMLVRTSRDPHLAAALVQRAVEGLQECTAQSQPGTEPEVLIRYRDVHLCVLKALQDPHAFGIQWTNKQVTRCVNESREEFKFNLEVVDCLVRSHLLNMPQLDAHVAIAMENGTNYLAVAFAMQLLQLYLVDERHNGHVSESDLFNTIDMLARINMHSRQPPEGLPNLIELLRANHDPSLLADRAVGGPTAHIHSGILQAREFDDPPGLLEKTEFLLREWVTIYHSPTASRDPTKAFSLFVHQMNCHGILKTDDLITRFFRLSTQMCVDLCYRALAEQAATSPTIVRSKCFHTLDAFVRLIALLVKHSGDTSNTATKINLLNKVVGIVAGVLLQDHEVHVTDFQQLPYHRIFVILFLELNTPEPVLEVINFQVLTAFCHILHILRPGKAPGFAYAWLELVSHRVFIGRLLAITPQQKGWGMYSQLLSDLFKFLAPFLRNAELNKPVAMFYKGTLRVLLVLLHDFPEFLCDYHYSFCDVIPPNCIQMRNLILSAFPRNMRLPDPFTPNLKVDMLPEISHAPRVLSNIASMIHPPIFKKDLDSYLKARAPVTFLSELRSNLQVSHEPGLRYNIQLMNALVLYVGTQAISHIRTKNLVPNMSTIAHSAHMDIFQNLAVDLDTEGRYLFLNAIANQLRYPNSHTHYFSCTLLYLFAEANTEAIQEQITRVLLERLIVNRPHPWGLLITFIELIKNPTYKFWNHEFVHCAPEIEKLFESVARSCMVQKQVQQNPDIDLVE